MCDPPVGGDAAGDPPVGGDAAGSGDVNFPDPEKAGAGIGALCIDEGVPIEAGLARSDAAKTAAILSKAADKGFPTDGGLEADTAVLAADEGGPAGVTGGLCGPGAVTGVAGADDLLPSRPSGTRCPASWRTPASLWA